GGRWCVRDIIVFVVFFKIKYALERPGEEKRKTEKKKKKGGRGLLRSKSTPLFPPPIEPRVCQGEVFCGCGLTLQEGRYRVVLNGPIYGREIGRDEFTRW